jgi:predicted amidohydrolase YtcJ
MLRRKIYLVTVSLAALTVAACSGESGDAAKREAAVQPADLVLRGGKIVTVDPALGTQQALAVDGYQIAAVGSDEEIAAYVGPETRVVELNGRFVMPGFIEGHGHFMGLGRSRQILDLTAVRNWDEVVTMVAAAVDQAEPGEWIFGRGWHQDKWDSVPADAVDGVPVNDSLSAVSANNPVLLEHASGHASFANDAALAAAAIDGETPDPEGGTIVRTAEGEATGLLRETAQDLLNDAVEQYEARLPPEQAGQLYRQQVELAGEEALQHGVTSFHDAGESFETIDFYRQLEQEGALPVRLYVMVRGETIEDMDQALPQYKMIAEGNDFLVVRSIKVQIDGALGSHGAWLLEPYEDMPESTGLVLEPVADVERIAEIAVKHGFQLCTHAIGTRANREVLDLYQRVWQRSGADGAALRWRIEHAQHLDAAEVPRFAALGVIAAMQGVHATSDGPWIPSRLGEERGGATSYIWRDLLNAGTTIGNGTDVPVERIDPIASFYSSVSRMMANGKRFHPEQIMTREEALKSYTINNAFAAFEEEVKGTLTPGKLADIVVLSQDLLTVPEAELPQTRVDMTIVGGEVRYERSQQ